MNEYLSIMFNTKENAAQIEKIWLRLKEIQIFYGSAFTYINLLEVKTDEKIAKAHTNQLKRN